MAKEKKDSVLHDGQTKKKNGFTIEPWSCVHRNGAWEIDAYSMVSGKREIIATIAANKGFSEDAIAHFIINAINIIDKRELLIEEMSMALEICLESKDGKLDWSAEHDAEVALRHANARTRI